MTILDSHPEENQIYLVLSSAKEIKKNNISLIREVTEKGYRTIVITSNQPTQYLREQYKKEGIDLEHVRFIDTITKYAVGKVPDDMPGSIFISNPGNLTDLSIAVSEILKDDGGHQTCVLIDSVNTMLIYIPSADITRFIHFVTSKLKILDLSGIFLAVEEGLDPVILTQLASFADEVLGAEEEE